MGNHGEAEEMSGETNNLPEIVQHSVQLETLLDMQQVASQSVCNALLVATAVSTTFCKLLHKCQTMDDVRKLLNDAEALVENEQ